jgi:DNA invertase Pin-like site-specific DNA recombinase
MVSMLKRAAIYARLNGTIEKLLAPLRQPVERRGDTVRAMYVDDGRMTGRGKYAGWRALIANVGTVDQIVLTNAGDLPGKQVTDLLKTLGVLGDHGIGLYLHTEGIDTSSGSFALLDMIAAYRRARLSEAIRGGQAKAVAAGKRIGRPIVPPGVEDLTHKALADGRGIRLTARQFKPGPCRSARSPAVRARRHSFQRCRAAGRRTGHRNPDAP